MGWPAQLLASPILFLCGPGGASVQDRFQRQMTKRWSSRFYEFVPDAARRYTRTRQERNAAMIREKISQALKDAMRAKDEAKTTTLRMVNAAIKQKDIDVARPRGDQQIGTDETLNLLQSLVKSRRELIELYKQGGRQDLVDKESAEIAIIEEFLPKQMSEDETRAAIREIVAATGASSVKDMGKVMAALKSKYAGQLDMTKASAAVKQVLSGQ